MTDQPAASFDCLFVPPEFAVPGGLTTEQFRLEPLGPQHNDADYAAWTASSDHIQATPGFAGTGWVRGSRLARLRAVPHGPRLARTRLAVRLVRVRPSELTPSEEDDMAHRAHGRCREVFSAYVRLGTSGLKEAASTP